MIVLRVVSLAFTLYSLAIILRALLPWFGLGYGHPVMRFLLDITEPLLAPLRRVVPNVNGLDFTPMVALLVLWVVERIITRLIVALL